jgi:hypothetical protein
VYIYVERETERERHITGIDDKPPSKKRPKYSSTIDWINEFYNQTILFRRVSKLWPVGQRWPPPIYVQELSMIFTFINSCGKNIVFCHAWKLYRSTYIISIVLASWLTMSTMLPINFFQEKSEND